MTLKEMREQVQFWLGLQDVLGSDTMPGTYNEAQMIPGLLQQGTMDLLSRTRCVVRCVHLHTLAGQGSYTLDHQILALVEIEDGARRRRRDETATGFTLVGADVLILKPTPSEDGEVDVWAVKRPQKMTLDADTPEQEQFGAIPPEYHDAIVTYALWKGADYTDDAGSGQSERYRILYEGQDGNGGRLSQIRSSVNKRATARAPRAKVSGLTPVGNSSRWIG